MDKAEENRGCLADLFPIKDLEMSTDSVFRAVSQENIELHGVTVFGECHVGTDPDPIILELLKRARKRIGADGAKVSLVLIGSGIAAKARAYFAYGADRIFVYDDPELGTPSAGQFTAVFRHFLRNYKPDTILGTNTTPSGKTLLTGLVKAPFVFHDQAVRVSSEFCADRSRHGELVLCEIPDLTD